MSEVNVAVPETDCWDGFIPSESQDTCSVLLEIEGANGNLAQTRLLPSMLRLFAKGYMRKTKFRLIARRSPSHWLKDVSNVSPATDWAETPDPREEKAAFRHYLEHVLSRVEVKESSKTQFLARCEFVQADVRRPEDFERLRVADAATRFEPGYRRIHYVSLLPKDYSSFVDAIVHSGVVDERLTVVFEKQFANSVKEAKALIAKCDRELGSRGAKYRIVDHYLRKFGITKAMHLLANDGMLGGLDFRRVESIELSLFEARGADRREHMFRAGVIEDQAISHGVQALTAIAMTPPHSAENGHVTASRLEFQRSLRPKNPERFVLGQYGPGFDYRNGYQQEIDEWEACYCNGDDRSRKPALPRDRPTYFAGTFESSLPRWSGLDENGQPQLDGDRQPYTPTVFALRHMLRASAKCIRLAITFRRPKNGFAVDSEGRPIPKTQVVIQLDPAPYSITWHTWTLVPGKEVRFREETNVSFPSEGDAGEDAYDLLLGDAVNDHWAWFPVSEEILTALELFEPVLENRHQLPIHEYATGSSGPEQQARALFDGWSLQKLGR